MNLHTCLLCLGSNLDGATRLLAARHALLSHFSDIRFSQEMVTEAIGTGFLSPFHNQVARFTSPLDAESQPIEGIIKTAPNKQTFIRGNLFTLSPADGEILPDWR